MSITDTKCKGNMCDQFFEDGNCIECLGQLLLLVSLRWVQEFVWKEAEQS